jgi:thioredoxin
MAKPITVTDEKFAEVVLQADGLVMVDFWATYCAAVRMVAPVVDELATDYADKAAIVKVNVDENPEYATQFQVRSTPTFIFFHERNTELREPCEHRSMVCKELAEAMSVNYRQDDAIWMVMQPHRAGLSCGEEMAVVAKSTAPTIRN